MYVAGLLRIIPHRLEFPPNRLQLRKAKNGTSECRSSIPSTPFRAYRSQLSRLRRRRLWGRYEADRTRKSEKKPGVARMVSARLPASLARSLPRLSHPGPPSLSEREGFILVCKPKHTRTGCGQARDEMRAKEESHCTYDLTAASSTAGFMARRIGRGHAVLLY